MRRLAHTQVLSALVAVAGGCSISVDFGPESVDGDAKADVDPDAICGNSTRCTETPVMLTDGAPACRVQCSQDFDLVDMSSLTDDVPEQVDVTITTMTLTFTDVAFRDAGGADVSPPLVPKWYGKLTVGGDFLAEVGGENTVGLFVELPTVDVPAAALKLAGDALRDGSALRGHCDTDYTLLQADLEAMAQEAQPVTLTFSFDASVSGTGERGIFD